MLNKNDLSKFTFVFIVFISILTLPTGIFSCDNITHVFVSQNLVNHGNLYLDDVPSWFLNSYTLKFNGVHYYSQYPPGLAILISPIIFILNYLNIGGQISLLQHNQLPQLITLICIKTISIFTYALTSLLIYRISRLLNLQEKTSLIAMITYSFGTIAWVYSGTLFTHSVSTFLNLLSVYFLIVFMNSGNYKNIVLSGLSISMSFWIRFDVILTLIPLLLIPLVYLQTEKESLSYKIRCYMGLLFPILFIGLIFFLYNAYITAQLGEFSYNNNKLLSVITIPNVKTLIDMFAGVHAGLFVFNPILFFWFISYPYFFI